MLIVLHDTAQMGHRDLRWENVMLPVYEDSRLGTTNSSAREETSYYVIDFDHSLPAPAAPHLNPDTHALEITQDNHDHRVDIWSIGHLLSQSGLLMKGQWKKMMETCLQENPKHRFLSASDCKQFLDEISC